MCVFFVVALDMKLLSVIYCYRRYGKGLPFVSFFLLRIVLVYLVFLSGNVSEVLRSGKERKLFRIGFQIMSIAYMTQGKHGDYDIPHNQSI